MSHGSIRDFILPVVRYKKPFINCKIPHDFTVFLIEYETKIIWKQFDRDKWKYGGKRRVNKNRLRAIFK